MPTIYLWDKCLLNPKETLANPVPFSRGGGRSLAGFERTIKSDRGYWSIVLNDIIVGGGAEMRAWNTMRTDLGGRSGLVAIPVRSHDSAPYVSGSFELAPALSVSMALAATIGQTVVKIRRTTAAAALSGIRFSYQHALYETGTAISIVADVWEVPVFPAIRAAIPLNAAVQVDLPTCLVRLADDRGMDLPQGKRDIQMVSVAFVEAVDYWNDLAA